MYQDINNEQLDVVYEYFKLIRDSEQNTKNTPTAYLNPELEKRYQWNK